MLDIRTLAEKSEVVLESLERRGQGALATEWQNVLDLDVRRRKLLGEVEALKAERNKTSEEVARLKKEKQDATAVLARGKDIATRIRELDEEVEKVVAGVNAKALEFPNILDRAVPKGRGSEDNVEVRKWGKPAQLSFPAKSHDEIGEALGLLDFKKGGEVSGARFVFLKGRAARLERALIQFMLDTHLAAGYQEMLPPFLVNRSTLTGTGQLPKFEEDVFRIEKFDYFLIPTAEVPVTNYHRNEILEESTLPIKYVAYTPCFRSEAGSYGRDTKGLKRQHQFNKVELVKFTTPETSEAELEALLGDAEKILQALGLAYRVVLLCGPDTGFSSAKTYDIEVWSPASNSYLEISSCSVFTDYQARRADIRYRRQVDRRVAHVHTINGSGLAVGRTLLAIMENFQRPDGDFDIPPVLRPYMESRI